MAMLLTHMFVAWVAVVYLGAEFKVEAYTVPDSLEQQLVLDLHNHARNDVINTLGVSPRNMLEMKYNETVEAAAGAWASQCIFGNGGQTDPTSGEQYGQNIYYAIGGSGGMPDVDYSRAVSSWEQEAEYYTYDLGALPGHVTTHFTQMIWWNSDNLGCAASSCSEVTGDAHFSNAVVIVCNYRKEGNVDGEDPYIAGDPYCKEEERSFPYLCRPHMTCHNGGVFNYDTGACDCVYFADNALENCEYDCSGANTDPVECGLYYAPYCTDPLYFAFMMTTCPYTCSCL